jgi:hypothetical protein
MSLAKPGLDTPPDQIRAYLRATGWTLTTEGWWWSPLREGVHVFGISDDRFGREPALRDPGIREIERAESNDYR